MQSVSYRIQLAARTASVSIDKTLSDLLALKLGFKPDTPEAKKAVCRVGKFYLRPTLTPINYFTSQIKLSCDVMLTGSIFQFV